MWASGVRHLSGSLSAFLSAPWVGVLEHTERDIRPDEPSGTTGCYRLVRRHIGPVRLRDGASRWGLYRHESALPSSHARPFELRDSDDQRLRFTLA